MIDHGYPFGKDELIMKKYEALFTEHSRSPVLCFEEEQELYAAYCSLYKRLVKISRISDSYQAAIKELLVKLQTAAAEIKTLSGCLPICASCKKIRDDEGYWQQVEHYLMKHSGAVFTHSVCSECARKLYSDLLLPAPEERPEHEGGSPKTPELDVEDAVIRRFLPTVNNEALASNPLYGDFKDIFLSYIRLLKRQNRIVRISDKYQSQLRELMAVLDISSRTDPLTKLCNRADMFEKLAAEQSRAVRYQKTFSLVMVDLDYFKQVNDTYGHLAGDQFLVAVAGLMRSNLRKEDSCARWGGEEFLILLPETELSNGTHTAEKLRGLIASITVPLHGEKVYITASLGVASYSPGETIDHCIKRADDALYLAKKNGRNRVAAAQ
ncbi:MAG: GGDEF domain-containing protein [Alphaproteobacteria bacterium]|uniref:diguanylate cyclase n=1 Tax=Candidatus Nitrobium versatile TaxID=2884831 RepID=A0A953JA08_9BACT|nr:GGDEF domain-containing protein [Candidatus Nitrobium versatile]